MRKVFICSTYYHLLIAICKIKITDDNTILVFTDIFKDNRIIDNMNNNELNIKIERKVEYIYKNKGVFFSNSKEKSFFEQFDRIFIFNDNTYIGHFLHRSKLRYHLVEDGYNYFSYFKRENYTIKRLLKKCLKNIPLPRGNSKYCQSIEVNDISVVPKDERYHKFKEVPRKDLFNNISEERKQLILRVFDVEELSEVAEKSVLILTQPLSIDGLMNSDDKQYGFYKKICDKYLSEGYEVYLKPHPRDAVTYEKMNGAKLIAQSVPMELIEMVSNVKFERIITHSSTAINFLTCGKEKEVFFDFNTREYDEKLLEKYNINKDEL